MQAFDVSNIYKAVNGTGPYCLRISVSRPAFSRFSPIAYLILDKGKKSICGSHGFVSKLFVQDFLHTYASRTA